MESILPVCGLLNLIIAIYLLSHTNIRCDSKSKKVKTVKPVDLAKWKFTVLINNYRFHQFK
jgi:hypothetical protein